MAKFTEETLSSWTKPPSDSEETKLQNAERMVHEAIKDDGKLSELSTEIFGQGSYANDTNVRLNSDIDINIRYTGGFYFDLPDGKTRSDYGLNSPSDYSVEEFKNDVETALAIKFGRNSIKRKNKCITVLGNSYRVETDVVPTWNYRRYSEDGSYVLGAEFRTDNCEWIINFPKQHIENGKYKNSNTSKRFKRLTRIYRRLRYKMIDEGESVSDNITSFLLECLIWNIPNGIFNNYGTWTDRLRESIIYLYQNTKEEETCKKWGEVSELLYLFHSERKWSREEVNNFLVLAWNFLEFIQ